MIDQLDVYAMINEYLNRTKFHALGKDHNSAPMHASGREQHAFMLWRDAWHVLGLERISELERKVRRKR